MAALVLVRTALPLLTPSFESARVRASGAFFR